MKIRIIFKDGSENNYYMGSYELKEGLLITKTLSGNTLYTNMYNLEKIEKIEIEEEIYDPNKRV